MENVPSNCEGMLRNRVRLDLVQEEYAPHPPLQYNHETNETVNRKAHEALDHGLQPIICVGETLSERDAGNAGGVVIDQVRRALAGFDADEVTKIVFAYEPVWAIGTGRTCAPDEADQMCHIVRSAISELFHSAYIGDSVRIQYGGSAKPDNAKVLLSMPNIDGLLVGGASLIVADFIEIIRATDTVAA